MFDVCTERWSPRGRALSAHSPAESALGVPPGLQTGAQVRCLWRGVWAWGVCKFLSVVVCTPEVCVWCVLGGGGGIGVEHLEKLCFPGNLFQKGKCSCHVTKKTEELGMWGQKHFRTWRLCSWEFTTPSLGSRPALPPHATPEVYPFPF